MHQRPQQLSRPASASSLGRLSSSASKLSLSAVQAVSRVGAGRETPILPSAMPPMTISTTKGPLGSTTESGPMFCGLPLKYIS